MPIKIKHKNEMKRLKKFLERDYQNAVKKATRRSLIRTLPTLAKASREELKDKQYRALKAKTFNSRTRRLKMLGAETIGMRFTPKPLRAIDFVKGAKKPRKQKGIPVKKRRVLKVEIKRGSVIRLPKSFIAKGRGSGYHVFRRQSGKLKRRSVVSLSHTVSKHLHIRRAIIRKASAKYSSELDHNLHFYINRIR